MKHVSSSPELIEFFNKLVPNEPDVQPRKMFVYPCFFINGNLTAGLHAHNMIMRFSDNDRAEFLDLPGAQIFETMPGRPMKQYAVMPPELLKYEERLKSWLDKSMAYVRSLPRKVK